MNTMLTKVQMTASARHRIAADGLTEAIAQLALPETAMVGDSVRLALPSGDGVRFRIVARSFEFDAEGSASLVFRIDYPAR